jgi:hypothetical protein
MPFSPFPSAVKINYHSVYAPHSQLVPTLQWSAFPDVGGAGSFATHNGSTIDADDMINALATILSGILPDTSTFDSYVIYNHNVGTDALEPIRSKPMVIVGQDATPGWFKAAQVTMSWRTAGFNPFKIVVLDNATNNAFDKTSALPGSGVLHDVDALVTDPDNGWAGRDNEIPLSFVSQTLTLNEALRKRYRLA